MERGKCARIANRLAQWVHSNPDVFDPEGVLTAGEILIRLPKDLQEQLRQLETEAVKEGAAERGERGGVRRTDRTHPCGKKPAVEPSSPGLKRECLASQTNKERGQIHEVTER